MIHFCALVFSRTLLFAFAAYALGNDDVVSLLQRSAVVMPRQRSLSCRGSAPCPWPDAQQPQVESEAKWVAALTPTPSPLSDVVWVPAPAPANMNDGDTKVLQALTKQLEVQQQQLQRLTTVTNEIVERLEDQKKPLASVNTTGGVGTLVNGTKEYVAAASAAATAKAELDFFNATATKAETAASDAATVAAAANKKIAVAQENHQKLLLQAEKSESYAISLQREANQSSALAAKAQLSLEVAKKAVESAKKASLAGVGEAQKEITASVTSALKTVEESVISGEKAWQAAKDNASFQAQDEATTIDKLVTSLVAARKRTLVVTFAKVTLPTEHDVLPREHNISLKNLLPCSCRSPKPGDVVLLQGQFENVTVDEWTLKQYEEAVVQKTDTTEGMMTLRNSAGEVSDLVGTKGFVYKIAGGC